MTFTHFNESGRAKMVDVGDKTVTERIAIAEAEIVLGETIMHAIENQSIKKGDVLTVAQIAGVMGAKMTSNLIPMCHPLLLNGVDLSFEKLMDAQGYRILATVKTEGKTGVEMEALTAVTTAALTIYDMCKAVDKGMEIRSIRLLEKTGGKAPWRR